MTAEEVKAAEEAGALIADLDFREELYEDEIRRQQAAIDYFLIRHDKETQKKWDKDMKALEKRIAALRKSIARDKAKRKRK